MTLLPQTISDAGTTVTSLTVRPSPDGLAGRASLRVDWAVASTTATRQLGYELQASPSSAFDQNVASSGPTEDRGQLDVPVPGEPLRSRELRHLRVRVATGHGWSGWSAPTSVEAGLLEPGDWNAVAVTLPDDPGARAQAPAPLLRTSFTLPAAPVRARLHVTSLGDHEVRINGRRVGDHLLDPGWTSYRNRLLVVVHDVTDLLAEGDNVLAGVLADGWYRGRIGWDPDDDRGRYGRQLGLLAQLEVDLADGRTVVVATDGSWRASTGEIVAADHYDGSSIDLRLRQDGWDRPGFDDSAWTPVAVVPLDLSILEPQVAPPVRVVETLRPQPLPGAAAEGSTLLDAGQNVAGFVRLVVRGREGETVTVRHAEVLEPDGSLHTRSLRTARATDSYVLADDAVVTLEPAFTFHGFRYAEVVTDAEILDAEVLAISSDTPVRGRFTCSDADLTRFHENVRWSQRDNFVSVPTDCPQRDERLGWTGDAQAFAPTACTLFDSRAFWTSWLVDLAHDQAADGGVPSVVPNVLGDGEFALGRAGWADAATIVPWSVHVAFADREALGRQLPSMKAHVGYLQARRHDDGLLGGEFQFGDWLDPDAPAGRAHEAKASSDYLANAFLAHSARLVARAGAVLGDAEADRYERLADEIARLTWARWGEHAVTTQTGAAVAIELGIAPEDEHEEIGAALARLVRNADGRIATGFLGTPLVLPALTRTGHLAEAYLMLLRRELPSWLYQVTRGATTVWERWDAIRADGSIHDGRLVLPDHESQMLSFNHYAYGAVVDWVYRTVAGIAPDADVPGYQHVILAPRPVDGIDHVAASVETALGRVSVEWSVDTDGTFSARYSLPFGVTATFEPPATEGSAARIDGREVTGSVTMDAGEHDVQVTAARVVSPAVPSLP
ncbi:MAG TPA: family 78 glycoside hydrolase catalytic domain [Kineosporiaceae bacterium]|nr:family 78 glycoside hydrolase catalytic domain [Kineosporiaceae bacterium]